MFIAFHLLTIQNRVRKTHAEAHGLLPDEFYKVSEGKKLSIKGKNNLYLDIHELGEGKVTAADVAGAHQKDLAVQEIWCQPY